MNTFESICGSWSEILVRVKLEGQLPVRLLQIFIAGILGNTEDFIKVLAILYPAITKRTGCQNTSLNERGTLSNSCEATECVHSSHMS